MNKRKIDALIPHAYDVLKKTGIVETKEGIPCINNTWRGYIASLGASISQGSVLAAVSYFSGSKDDDKGSKLERNKLIVAIQYLLELKQPLYTYVKEEIDQRKVKENIVDAAIALKLAMNLYERYNDKSEGGE
jgi:hypothetical protein